MSVEETNNNDVSSQEEKVEEKVEETPPAEGQEAEEEITEEEKKPEEPPIDKENIEESLKEKGFDYNELQEEYLANGDLSAETREKLAKIGISKEFIEDFIAGKKAQIEKKIAEEQEI